MKNVVLVLVILLIGFLGWRIVNYLSPTVKTAVEQELALEQFMGDNYSFFYPKEWVQKEEEESFISYIEKDENGEETGNGSSVKILKFPQQLKPASKETCQAIAQDLVSCD